MFHRKCAVSLLRVLAQLARGYFHQAYREQAFLSVCPWPLLIRRGLPSRPGSTCTKLVGGQFFISTPFTLRYYEAVLVVSPSQRSAAADSRAEALHAILIRRAAPWLRPLQQRGREWRRSIEESLPFYNPVSLPDFPHTLSY